MALFSPVISRLPSPADAGRLWDHVIGLASFAGFAELKRSLRERPQLASFGIEPDEIDIQEDWHGGSRPQKIGSHHPCGPDSNSPAAGA